MIKNKTSGFWPKNEKLFYHKAKSEHFFCKKNKVWKTVMQLVEKKINLLQFDFLELSIHL